MKIAIVEDEALAAERLEELVREIDPAAEIAARLTSVIESVAWLKLNKPDLILMDIQLTDGSCFAIFEQLKVDVPVIFTTAYDTYAIQAFKVNSIDYLLKPIKREELRAGLEKYKSLRSLQVADLTGLLQTLRPSEPAYKKRFMLQYGEDILKIETSDIAYFFAMEKNVLLTTFQRHTYGLDFTLDRLQRVLDPERFFRINRKMIVNYDAIKRMHAYSRSRIKLDLMPPAPSGVESLVSIERTPAFKAWMDK